MGILSAVSKLFKARLHIGYLAVPYTLLGFFVNWALHNFSFTDLLSNDPNSFIRIILSCLIAFIYMPYLFLIESTWSCIYVTFKRGCREGEFKFKPHWHPDDYTLAKLILKVADNKL